MNNTMNNNVVSKETAILLKEAGFPQETEFYWSAWSDHSVAENKECHELHWELTDKDSGSIAPRYAAPLATEILEVLPATIDIEDDEGTPYLMMYKNRDQYKLCYESAYEEYPNPDRLIDEDRWFASLQEAAARLYIYLSKHNLLSKE